MNFLPKTFRQNMMVTLFGLTKIPLILWIGPRVLQLDEKKCEIIIPYNMRTKNHLKSLYFGTMCVGADLAGGLLAMDKIFKKNPHLELSFKTFHAQFLKRANGDTVFVSEDGEKIDQLIEKALLTKDRVEEQLRITAFTKNYSMTEPVAIFDLTLSLKLKVKVS